MQMNDASGNRRFQTGDDKLEVEVVGVSSWAAIGRTGDFWTALPEMFVGASSGAAVPSAPDRAGTVAVSAQDYTEVCSTCAMVEEGSRIISTGGVSLVGTVRRGDRIIVGGETLVVSSSGVFSNESIPLSSAFRGESAAGLPIYLGGENTGTHSVSFTPTVRGDYEIRVSAPRRPQVQRVRTVLSSEGSGSFVLAYPGTDGMLFTTAPIAFNATAADVASALVAAVPLFETQGVNISVTRVAADAIADAADEEERAATADGLVSAPITSLSVEGSNSSAFVDEFGGRAWDIAITASTDAGLEDIETFLSDDSDLVGGSLDISVVDAGAPSTAIGGSPFRVSVTSDGVNSAQSTAVGQGLVRTETGGGSSFTVILRDQYGNDLGCEHTAPTVAALLRPTSLSTAPSMMVPFVDDVTSQTVRCDAGDGISGPSLRVDVEYNATSVGKRTLAVGLGIRPEIQQITVVGASASEAGTSAGQSSSSIGSRVYRIILGGEISKPIAFDASAAELTAALEECLPAVAGRVDVSQTTPSASAGGDPTDGSVSYSVTFSGVAGDVPQMVADDADLQATSDGTRSVVVSTLQDGQQAHIKTAQSPLVAEQQVIRISFPHVNN